jgi:uncharacterized protein
MVKRIWVIVKPQARKEEIVRLAEGEYRVLVHAPAKEGKANEAVVELLASHFSVAKSAIRIIRGQSARRKLIEIS